MALVIANTMVKHSVAGGEYTSRRAQVEEAAAVIGRHRPEVKFLRDATLDDLARWGSEMSAEAVKRARHVISENTRTVAAADALMRGDLQTLGRLMAEAHASYSRDFEASCVEADAMVALAQDLPGLSQAALDPAEDLADARSILWSATLQRSLRKGTPGLVTRLETGIEPTGVGLQCLERGDTLCRCAVRAE